MKANHELSNKVDNARIAIKVLSWLNIIAGAIVALAFMYDNPAPGFIFIGVGVMGLILCGILQGFFAVAYASELYIYNNQPQETKETPEQA